MCKMRVNISLFVRSLSPDGHEVANVQDGGDLDALYGKYKT